ncbi:MAG: FAD-binding protein [Clostridia bacterium]
MKKIIVLGCGLGGLIAALKLAQKGYSVTIYEKKKREDLGYPWYDAVSENIFSDIGLDTPWEAVGKKIKCTFTSPDCNATIQQVSKAVSGLDIQRQELIIYLLNLVEPLCEIKYEQNITSLYIEDERVNGIIIGEEIILSNLVIDASGASSPFRKDIPKKFGITSELQKKDLMHGYRAYFKRNKNALAQPINNTYLKHLGKIGISWCKEVEGTESVDVFIGRVGELTESEIIEGVMDLQKRNPVLSDIPIYEIREKLAIRCPLSVFVADGYALCGDSAFMEMPLIGSGIESSMRAGNILADIILKKKTDTFYAKDLWPYEVKFMRSIGSNFIMFDVIKQWAMNLSSNDLNWVFNSGLFTQNIYDIMKVDFKSLHDFTPKEIFRSMGLALKRKDLSSGAIKVLTYAGQAKIVASMIPNKYEWNKIVNWQQKYDSFSNDNKKTIYFLEKNLLKIKQFFKSRFPNKK